MEQSIIRKKEIAIGAIVVGINLLVLGLGSWFLTLKIIDSSNEFKQKKTETEALQQAWQDARNEQKQLQKIMPDIENANQSFFSEAQPINFLNSLEDLARQTGNLYSIKLMSLETDAPKKTGTSLPSLAFQIYLAGSFNNFMHYLKYLENMKYYVQMDSLQISQTANEIPFADKGKNIAPGSIYGILNIRAFTR